MNTHRRSCPQCNKPMVYVRRCALLAAEKKKSICRICTGKRRSFWMMGRVPWNKGVIQSAEFRTALSLAQRRWHNNNPNPKIESLIKCGKLKEVDGHWCHLCPQCKTYCEHTGNSSRSHAAEAIRNKRTCQTCADVLSQPLILSGAIWCNEEGKWCRKCPTCGQILEYGVKQKAADTHSRGKTCRRCLIKRNHSASASLKRANNITGFRRKTYTFPNGEVVNVQGYEPLTLDKLIAEGTPQHVIRVSAVDKPVISYEFDGKVLRYYPDCYLSDRNTIVETKSTWTWSGYLAKNEAKLKASEKAGYNVRLIIWDGKKNLVADVLWTPTFKLLDDRGHANVVLNSF